MTPKKIYEFVVIKKTYTFGVCSECKGTGKKKRVFRQMTFVEDCPSCDNGRVRFSHTEEFPLSDAIKEIQSNT